MVRETFVMPDGVSLPGFCWCSSGGRAPRGVFVAVHGFGGTGRVFDRPARSLSGLGITTYSYDQRGFGDAPRDVAWPGAARLIDDVNAVADLVRRRHPSVPLYLYGTSMGAAVILASARARRLPDTEGVLLLAPALLGWGAFGLVNELLLRVVAAIAPNARHKQWSRSLTGISDNPELLHAVLNDPEIQAGTRFGALKGLLDLATTARGSGAALQAPTMLLFGRRDLPALTRQTRELAREIAGPKRVLLYTEGYHALDHDLQRENLFHDIQAWLTDRSGQLPSTCTAPPAAEEVVA